MRLVDRFQSVGVPKPLGRAPVVARDRVLGRTCMLKLASVGSSLADQLAHEGRLLGELCHPNLVQLVDRFVGVSGFWDWGPVTGFAMDWVDGAPLTRAAAGADLGGRLESFGQLLDVVGYLHARGTLHLDLKPANIFRSDAGVVLLDLGSARPLDAGPGEAGGTLGYASPEVLAGQAASVAADVFSLGAVFYEVLTGARPHGSREGSDLRQAVLVGDILPVRAVRADVPRELARLVEQMLAVEPGSRPASVRDVRDALGAAGWPAPLRVGMPPFVGRADTEAALTARLVEGRGDVVAVVGEAGSGRTRLIRRVLRRLSGDDGVPALDLSLADRADRALRRLAMLAGGDLPPPDAGPAWRDALAGKLRAGHPLAGVVFLGRREDLDDEARELADTLTPALVEGGFRVLWAASEAPSGSETVEVGPLSEAELATVGDFFGAPPGGRIRDAILRSGGLPGPFARLVAPGLDELAALPRDERDALLLLCALPAGVPASLVETLPEPVRRALPALLARRDLRSDEEGVVYVQRHASGGVLPETVATALAEVVLSPSSPVDALWQALFAARAGRLDAAAALFADAERVAAPRRDELEELARLLVAHGFRPARASLARMLLEDGLAEAAVGLLDGVVDRTQEEVVLLVRGLRTAGNLDAAAACAREAFDRGGPPELWLELARIAEGRGDLDEAYSCCRRATDASAELAAGPALALELSLSVALMDKGRTPERLDALLAEVEERADRDDLDAAALSAAGRIYGRLGDLRRSERMMARAAEAADREGRLRTAAGIRLNRGNALVRLGRGRQARDVYNEALRVATRADAPDLMLRLHYALARLELTSGRLPSAENHITAFRELAVRSAEPEAEARAALLDANLQVVRERPQAALDRLRDIDAGRLDAGGRVVRDILFGRALLALGRPAEALSILQTTPSSTDSVERAVVASLKGRAHMALGRSELSQAREDLPSVTDPSTRFDIGGILLAAGGEDLDPGTFAERRRDLDRAAHLLRGVDAARAATLRDRLLEGPGAGLDGIVALTESMQDRQAFPGALARLVTEALGAHRCLIILRMPGLGTQRAWTELSGNEAAGITDEVLRRIQRPEDFWLAADAFADPHLRESSQTVRTFELKSLLAVAIPLDGKAVGALYVDDLYRANRFTEEDVAVLSRLAASVGRMLPLLPTSAQSARLVEPVESHGVLLSDVRAASAIERSIKMISNRDEVNVLLTGPTGSGKTWFAQRLAKEVFHQADLEMIALHDTNAQMLISALAGTKRGEFTGSQDSDGAIRRCLKYGRPLFLDEVQNIGKEAQGLLLPLLDFPRRLQSLTGSAEPLSGPLHIILGTNVPIDHGQWEEHFRSDLWYRMNRTRIELPALVDRGSEVIYRYLSRMLVELGAPVPELLFEPAALQYVTSWSWPGNLRELRSFAEAVAHLVNGLGIEVIRTDHLRDVGLDVGGTSDPDSDDGSEMPSLRPELAVKDLVMSAIRQNAGVQVEAAKVLGWTPSRLNKWLRRHELLEWAKEIRMAAAQDGAAT